MMNAIEKFGASLNMSQALHSTALQGNPYMVGFVCVALAATFVLDISDMYIAVLGALTYYLLQCAAVNGKPIKSAKAAYADDKDVTQENQPSKFQRRSYQPEYEKLPAAAWDKPKQRTQLPALPKDEVRTASAAPIAPATFSSSKWQDQVKELVMQSRPTTGSFETVQGLVKIVEDSLLTNLPEAQISGYVTANPLSAKAFGVAIPEIDIVLNADVHDLKRRLVTGSQGLCGRQLQKAAVRACTDVLVATSGLKFRRSAFQSEEPKVIFLAPATLEVAEIALGVNFSVNSSTPVRCVSLMEECDKLEPLSCDLILLVRRWSRDRGIAHSAKGHLPPYAWTLLCIYFLQVGVSEEGGLLPPMSVKDGALKKRKRVSGASDSKKNVAVLLKEFFVFYAGQFDWCKETASVRTGDRNSDRRPQAFPIIEDPFDSENVAACLTSASLDRLKEEFSRAKDMCNSLATASLEDLLLPWAPPEEAANKEEDADAGPDADNWRTGSLSVSKRATGSNSPVSRPVSALQPGSLTGAATTSLRPGGSLTAAPTSLRPGSLTAAPTMSLRPGGSMRKL